MPGMYYIELAEEYALRRDLLLGALREAGFKAYKPGGAYYIMTDISAFASADDREFAGRLVKDIGVAAVPGSSFYSRHGGGSQQLRFTFCKQIETLHRALGNLRKLQQG
jgi:aminotransferase